MKSYGRAPTFLAMTGYEQVRSIAAALAGDMEAARSVELQLPETGVCSGGGLLDDKGEEDEPLAVASSGGCCGPAQPAPPVGVPAQPVHADRCPSWGTGWRWRRSPGR